MSAKKVIAVFGATGAQGGGLVKAILADKAGGFAVRAITRDVTSDKAKALAAAGAEVVAADVDDAASVARALKGRRNITVLTPSLPIANVLAEEPGIRLMLTGGTLRPGERSLVGELAVGSFREFRFDTVVLGVGGIDIEDGLTEYNLDDARVKRAAIEIARRIIVVADATKLGRVAFARICSLEEVDILVTDDAAPPDFVASLASAGVEVRLA